MSKCTPRATGAVIIIFVLGYKMNLLADYEDSARIASYTGDDELHTVHINRLISQLLLTLDHILQQHVGHLIMELFGEKDQKICTHDG
jgi:hypothetical protein